MILRKQLEALSVLQWVLTFLFFGRSVGGGSPWAQASHLPFGGRRAAPQGKGARVPVLSVGLPKEPSPTCSVLPPGRRQAGLGGQGTM